MKKLQKVGLKKRLMIKAAIVVIFCSLILGCGGYIFWQYEAIADFSFANPPDGTNFLTPDETRLSEVADGFDKRYSLYHMPLNQSAGTIFNNDSLFNGGAISYTNVSEYRFGDNEALFTSIDFTGWVFKYLTARQEGNAPMELFAYQVLINLTTGLSLLMAVPNGGLGPDYLGILGRGVCAPENKNIWPYIFKDAPKHYNGTGIYSQWRYRAYTSNDEHGGYYLFLAVATKFLKHLPEIYTPVALIVDQLCNYMIRNNFLGIHGSGGTSGVDQKTRGFSGGFWIPLLLKLGAIHYPEKYSSIYYQYVANEMYFLSASEGGRQEVFANYYAYNFGLCVCLGFFLVEEPGSKIWQRFFEGYYQSMWVYTRNHRNAWSNAIFLMINFMANITNPSTGEKLPFIASDIGDQLQRFATHLYPQLDYRTPTDLPDGYVLITPVKAFTDALGMDTKVQRLLGISAEEQFTNKPLTVEYIGMRNWYWSGNPYSWEPNTKENLLHEERGSSFTVPYWMMRYMGYYSGGSV